MKPKGHFEINWPLTTFLPQYRNPITQLTPKYIHAFIHSVAGPSSFYRLHTYLVLLGCIRPIRPKMMHTYCFPTKILFFIHPWSCKVHTWECTKYYSLFWHNPLEIPSKILLLLSPIFIHEQQFLYEYTT